jgi:hypothetical protein
MTHIRMSVNVNSTYSVEHKTGLFIIELCQNMYATCFGPISGLRQAGQYKGKGKGKTHPRAATKAQREVEV